MRPDLIESASDGIEWHVELWPEGVAQHLVFRAEIHVDHNPANDVNRFLRFCTNVAPVYEQLENDSSWRISITMSKSLTGGVTYDHIATWIECWVSSLEWSYESLSVF